MVFIKYVLLAFLLVSCASGFTVDTMEHDEKTTLFRCKEVKGIFEKDNTIAICQNPALCAMVCDLHNGRKMRPVTDATELLIPPGEEQTQ